MAIGTAATTSRYELLAPLAEGGMAEVFLARSHLTMGPRRDCVLKRIRKDHAADPLYVRMFLAEARITAQLQHPNVVLLYDVGRTDDGYFMTLEHVAGHSLHAIARRARTVGLPLPVGFALGVAASVAAGLHHAHTRRDVDGWPLHIVHRDVSPPNVMIGCDGTIKLIDFGVATSRANMLSARLLAGKYGYFAPEQCAGREVDHRADIFSLGVVLWELLTGARLYGGSRDLEALARAMAAEVPAPSALRRTLPPELDRVVLRMLAYDPAQRYASALAVVDDLDAIAARYGVRTSATAIGQLTRALFDHAPVQEATLELTQTITRAVPQYARAA